MSNHLNRSIRINLFDKENRLVTTCAIVCSVSSQQLALDSAHVRLLEPRSNEFEFELDIENSEIVKFTVSDFVHAGNNYAVSVVATRNGTAQTWTHTNGTSSSPTENDEIDLTIEVTATASGVPTLNGGCVIRVQPRGKPD